jgi:hypothetical protein
MEERNLIIKNHLIQAYKQAPWRIRTQTSTLFLVAIVLAACVIWVMVSISIQAADAGLQIQELTFEQLKLNREIADLRSQGAMFTSSSGMEKRAEDMGFHTATNEDLTYSVVKGFTGRKPQISAPPPGSDLPPVLLKPSYTQSLSDWLWQGVIKLSENNGSFKP